MNMVIHDTRNPTNSIKVGLKETIKQLQQIEVLFKEAREFTQKNEQLQEKLEAPELGIELTNSMF